MTPYCWPNAARSTMARSCTSRETTPEWPGWRMRWRFSRPTSNYSAFPPGTACRTTGYRQILRSSASASRPWRASRNRRPGPASCSRPSTRSCSVFRRVPCFRARCCPSAKGALPTSMRSWCSWRVTATAAPARSWSMASTLSGAASWTSSRRARASRSASTCSATRLRACAGSTRPRSVAPTEFPR